MAYVYYLCQRVTLVAHETKEENYNKDTDTEKSIKIKSCNKDQFTKVDNGR